MIYQLSKENYYKIIKLGNRYDENFERKYLGINNDIYVYEKEQVIKGFLIIEKTIDEIGIILLYVSDDYRHQGVGSMLLEYLFSIAKNLKRIILEVSANNTWAIKLYKKYNFIIINTRKNYYGDNSDAYLMEKRLNNE